MTRSSETYLQWRSIAKGYRSHNSLTQYEQVSENCTLLYWRVFSIQLKHSATAVFFEIYYDTKNKTPIILGSTIHKGNDSVFSDTNKIEFSTLTSENKYMSSFQATTFMNLIEITGKISHSIGINKNWELQNIDILVTFMDPVTKKKEKIKRWNEGRSASFFGRKLLPESELNICPYCLSSGYSTSYAIPKEDYDSGASGYDLYSCNKISSQLACTHCDGNGAKYESWYVDENPEYSGKNHEYKPGTGKLKITFMEPQKHIGI